MNVNEKEETKDGNVEKTFFLTESKLDFSKFEDIHEIKENSQFKVFEIQHKAEFSKLMDLFRGILNTKELSFRALALTTALLMETPTDCTIWWYRMNIVEKLCISMENEHRAMQKLLPFALKTYQYWNYKLWLSISIEKKPFDYDELKGILELDTRNFHAWNYLTKVAEHFRHYDESMRLISYFIDKEYFNNSAWNARRTILQLVGYDPNTEIEYALSKISNNGKNEAVRNYLRMLLNAHKTKQHRDLIQSKLKEVLSENPFDRSIITLSIEIAIENNDNETKVFLLDKLIQIDSVLTNFWKKFFQ